jgi:hypothetical protein
MIFYDKTCNIFTKSIVEEGNREVRKETLLYENVQCDFFTAKSNSMRDVFIGEVAKEEET